MLFYHSFFNNILCFDNLCALFCTVLLYFLGMQLKYKCFGNTNVQLFVMLVKYIKTEREKAEMDTYL